MPSVCKQRGGKDSENLHLIDRKGSTDRGVFSKARNLLFEKTQWVARLLAQIYYKPIWYGNDIVFIWFCFKDFHIATLYAITWVILILNQ